MSASQISYRVKKRFWPHLETLGFTPHVQPREWAKNVNDVLCAVSIFPAPCGDYSGFEDVNPGSLMLDVGIDYERLHLGRPRIYGDDRSNGIGVCPIRLSLTRGQGTPGPQRTNIWDVVTVSPDDTITDMIAAIDEQATPFFESWTDPQFAYDAFAAGGFLRHPDGKNPQGVGQISISASPTSMAYAEIQAELASRLERFDEEADHIERLLDLGGGSEAHKERLATLRSR